MKKLRVGVDSYSLKPLDLSPFELLEWAVMNGADGVQFSEVNVPPGTAVDKTFLQELRSFAAENRLYIEWGGGEHIPFDLASGQPKDILPGNRKAAEQAFQLGASTVRSCSGGLMRWKKDSPSTEEFLRLTAAALRVEKPMLRDFGVVLAIETHFEFTSFELLRLFDMCGAVPGEYLGICLDTMNLLTMLEDPVLATRRLLPWVVTTHIKDGGLMSRGGRLRLVHGGGGQGRDRPAGHLRGARRRPSAHHPDRRGPRRRFPHSRRRRRFPGPLPGPRRPRARPPARDERPDPRAHGGREARRPAA